MKILAIDTSASFCSACIYCGETGTLLSKKTTDIGRGHAELLMDHIEACFEDANLKKSEIDRIAVTVGPGSFTGVRVGLAAAKGLCMGLGIPLIAVSTLEAAMFQVNENGDFTALAAVLDARRGQACYQIENQAPAIASWEALSSELSDFEGQICGSGAELMNEHLLVPKAVAHTNASAVIESVAKLSIKKPASSHTVEPIYLRSADAKKQAGAALPRSNAKA